jgi:oligoribonuclease
MQPDAKNLIWLDLEMTGLNRKKDKILEIAIIITNSDLNTIAESPVLAIYQPDSVLNLMDEWNQTQHSRSGLLDRVKTSDTTVESAEKTMLDFVMRYVPPNKSPMCGNSICQDRQFLYRWMPSLEAYFHYRNLDVSVFKELAYRWKPSIIKGFKKKAEHLALADVRESIEELRYYRKTFINLEA